MRKILIVIGNLFDVGWWADKINRKLGVYERTQNTKFYKWQEGLTGWKYWCWQILGGGLFVIVLEYVLNLIGMPMLPWR